MLYTIPVELVAGYTEFDHRSNLSSRICSVLKIRGPPLGSQIVSPDKQRKHVRVAWLVLSTNFRVPVFSK